MNRIKAIGASSLCAAMVLATGNGSALGPWQDYRSRAIFSWVKSSDQASCLLTPYGIIQNNCAAVAELDMPVPYDFGEGWHGVSASVYRSGTPTPYCQALGVGWDGTAEVVGPLIHNSLPAGNWASLNLGKLQAPSGGTFVACWLNPGDKLDSVQWTLSGTDP